MNLRPLTAVALFVAACTPSPSPDPSATSLRASAPASAPSTEPAAATPAAPVQAAPPVERAAVGKPAPDFALKDLDGREVKLSSFRGKTVVLEWFNPGCPFVNAAHTLGSLKGTAARHAAKGIVWLAINSSAKGRQGNGVDANAAAKTKYELAHPVLLDESGEVGRAYGATNTPHMFVVDPKGVLAYRGAIDNSPDGEGQSPTGPTLVNYVDAALADVAAGRAASTPETKAYGCSVKYAQN